MTVEIFEPELEDDSTDEVESIDDKITDRLEKTWTRLTIQSIELYFEDKPFHCGGPIPPKHLYSEKNIHLVRDCDFGKGIEACHEVLSTKSALGLASTNLIGLSMKQRLALQARARESNVRTLLGILQEVKNAGMPREFHPGLILLHLKFCLGYKISEEVYSKTKLDPANALLRDAG